MRSNTIEVKTKIRNHILECVTDENGDNYTDYKDACRRLQSEFNRVANYPDNIQKFSNVQLRFADYMRGIPFGFEYYYNGITEFLDTLDINPNGKVYTDEQSESLYYNLIYREVMSVK